MPKLTVWFTRASLVHLAIGFTLGGLLLLNKGVALDGRIWMLLPGHIELMLTGWILQLVMGMAFWILPRFGQGPARGNEAWAWIAFVGINLGVGLNVLSWLALGDSGLVMAARLIELVGVAAFTAHAWPRVKAFRR
jgi:hypothetical protein